MTGRTSTVIQPLSTPGQVWAISTASSMVSVSSTEYPPSASLVSMNGPSVTPLARTVLAVAGGWSWWPPSTSLPEPPPPFSYQAPISAYHAWPSASDMFPAASVSSSRMTYLTVASMFHGCHDGSLSPSPRTAWHRFRHHHAPDPRSHVPPARGQPGLHGQDGIVAPPDIGPVGGFGHRALAGPVDHGRLLQQHPALPLGGGLGHDPGQRLEHAHHHRRHAQAGLPDLLEGTLHQALVGRLGRDDPDEPPAVPVHPRRWQLGHHLAQFPPEPVDAGQRGKGVVDRCGKRPYPDLYQLVDAERHVLAESPVRADDVRPSQRLAHQRRRLRRPDRREPVSAHDEVPGPVLQVDHRVGFRRQLDQVLVPDELHVPAGRGEQNAPARLGAAPQLARRGGGCPRGR